MRIFRSCISMTLSWTRLSGVLSPLGSIDEGFVGLVWRALRGDVCVESCDIHIGDSIVVNSHNRSRHRSGRQKHGEMDLLMELFDIAMQLECWGAQCPV